MLCIVFVSNVYCCNLKVLNKVVCHLETYFCLPGPREILGNLYAFIERSVFRVNFRVRVRDRVMIKANACDYLRFEILMFVTASNTVSRVTGPGV